MNEDDLDALVHRYSTLIEHMEVSRFTTVAGFTVLIWDHLLTFSEEKRLIWPARCSLVKVLFLVNRYVTPILQAMNVYQMSRMAHFSDSFCKNWTVISGAFEITSLGISNFLLLLRVYALWGRKRTVLWWMVGLYILTYISIISTSIISIVQLYPKIHFSPIAKICMTDHRPEIMSAIWAAPLGFEVLIFLMTAIKAIEHARNNQIHTPVLRSLYFDQLWYFLVIIVARVLNLLLWVAFPSSLLFLGLYIIWSLVTAFVSRIMLNLRGVCNSSDWAEETTLDTKSDIEWAHDFPPSRSDLDLQRCPRELDEQDTELGPQVTHGSDGCSNNPMPVHNRVIKCHSHPAMREKQWSRTPHSSPSPTRSHHHLCMRHLWANRRGRQSPLGKNSVANPAERCTCGMEEDIELDEVTTVHIPDEMLEASNARWRSEEQDYGPWPTTAGRDSLDRPDSLDEQIIFSK